MTCDLKGSCTSSSNAGVLEGDEELNHFTLPPPGEPAGHDHIIEGKIIVR